MEDAPYFLMHMKQHTHMENSLEKLDRENPRRVDREMHVARRWLLFLLASPL
jgi:hypothetical protein